MSNSALVAWVFAKRTSANFGRNRDAWGGSFQQKTCNNSETGQDRPTLLLSTNRELNNALWIDNEIDDWTTLNYTLDLLRKFNSPNHGSNLQHIKHQAKTTLIKSIVTGEPTKLFRRRSNGKIGKTKLKCSRHIITTCTSVVLNNFMKKRLTTKSIAQNMHLSKHEWKFKRR